MNKNKLNELSLYCIRMFRTGTLPALDVSNDFGQSESVRLLIMIRVIVGAVSVYVHASYVCWPVTGLNRMVMSVNNNIQGKLYSNGMSE